MMLRLKTILLVTLALFSFSSMAQIKEKEYKNDCESFDRGAIVVEKNKGKHFLSVVYVDKTYKASGGGYLRSIFLRGDSFGISLKGGQWISSDYVDDIKYRTEEDGDETIVFSCLGFLSGKGYHTKLAIDADTYELLAKQKWLSKEQIGKY
tara:strand:- start:327 stop:779 length:453 start_codon:yes stop_codon:yes gene_type:complete